MFYFLADYQNNSFIWNYGFGFFFFFLSGMKKGVWKYRVMWLYINIYIGKQSYRVFLPIFDQNETL